MSYDKVGDVLVAQGKLDEALKAYRDGLAIGERLAAADRSNSGWQRDLSVSYNKVGDVLVAQGKLDEALKAYRDSLAIRERLAAADRGNSGWQRDLSVSYNRVGDVLVAQGKLDEALKAYRDSLAIRERLPPPIRGQQMADDLQSAIERIRVPWHIRFALAGDFAKASPWPTRHLARAQKDMAPHEPRPCAHVPRPGGGGAGALSPVSREKNVHGEVVGDRRA